MNSRAPYGRPDPLRVRPKLFCPSLILVLLAGGLCTTASAQPLRNTGLVFSELHHQDSPFVGPGGTLPSYVELLNREIPSGVAQTLAVQSPGLQLRCQRNGLSDAVTIIPPGTFIPPRGILIVTALPFPGIPIVPTGIPFFVQQHVDPAFFQNGAAANAAPCQANVPQRFCLSGAISPAILSPPDRIELVGPVAQTPCAGNFTAAPQLPFIPNPFGHVNRVLFVDSDTHFDFDGGVPSVTPVPPATLPTPLYIENPGQVPPSQGLDNVNGLLFGPGPSGAPINVPNPVPFPTAATPTPFFVGGPTTSAVSGTIAFTVEPIRGVSVPNHPRFPVITNPNFDRLLASGGRLVCNANLVGVDPLFAQFPGSTTPAIPNMTWNVRVPSTTPAGPDGVLTINMLAMAQKDVRFALAGTGTLAGRPRIERIYSDDTPDSTAGVTGDASGVQIDMIPGSTGTADIWCDVIIYDENGFSYRAKVRNWPNTPTNCTQRNLGLGSNAVGNIDIIALCYTPQPTPNSLYILPSLTIFVPTGGGPLFGLTPDAMTLAALLLPVGAHPFHVQATLDGLYFYSLTNVGLSGLSLDVSAVEFDPANGFTLPFATATLTVL